jgi:protein MpaA
LLPRRGHRAHPSPGRLAPYLVAVAAVALTSAACAQGGGAAGREASRGDRAGPSPRLGPSTARESPGRALLGRSGEGRRIHVLRVGNARARLSMLVIGAVHGNEPAGRAVVARLRRAQPPRRTSIWLVGDLNPDGSAAGTRQNARGVDLNRNFPHRWRGRGRPFDTYHSGARPLSEPESRAIARFVERVRPRVTIWYHQALRIVVRGEGDPAFERLYSRHSGLPRRRLPRYPGTAVSWQNHRFPSDSAFVVELPGGRLAPAEARRHAHAVLALAGVIAR